MPRKPKSDKMAVGVDAPAKAAPAVKPAGSRIGNLGDWAHPPKKKGRGK